MYRATCSGRASRSRWAPEAIIASLPLLRGDEPGEALWEPPTPDEWRRAMRIIAMQFVLQISGSGRELARPSGHRELVFLREEASDDD